jgi:hypothetical protein
MAMTFFKKALPALLVFPLLLGVTGCGSTPTKTSATVTPESGTFGVQEGNNKDIEVKLDPAGHTLKEIVCENATVGPDGKPFSKGLKESTDYVKKGDTYTFLKEFLATLDAESMNYIVFKMDSGNDPKFTIHIVPDESGFTIDWMLMHLTPEDAIQKEQSDNKSLMTSQKSVEELTAFYQEAMSASSAVEITPQYEADWWQAVKAGDFIYAVYLKAGAAETDITLTFYLENEQPK